MHGPPVIHPEPLSIIIPRSFLVYPRRDASVKSLSVPRSSPLSGCFGFRLISPSIGCERVAAMTGRQNEIWLLCKLDSELLMLYPSKTPSRRYYGTNGTAFSLPRETIFFFHPTQPFVCAYVCEREVDREKREKE